MSPLGRYSIYCDHGIHVGFECVRCWQRRALDAEAALTACAAARDAALQDLSDNAVWHHAIMGERCPPSDDERHCTCVPVLRQRIETLTAERDDWMRTYRLEHKKHTASLVTWMRTYRTEHEKHTASLVTIAELREELAKCSPTTQ